MLQAAESIGGEYLWGVYDLLVLPPSFPYGGMENPCLTFVTPTTLVKSRNVSYKNNQGNLLVVVLLSIAAGWGQILD